MSGLDQLLDLQDHDLAADQVRHRLANHPLMAELSEARAAHEQATAAHGAAHAAQVEAQRAQKRLEDELATLTAKVDKVHGQLYGGTISAAGDLQALQRELDSLHGQRDDLEMRLLESMESSDETAAATEEAAKAVEAAAETVADVDQRLQADQADLRAELEKVEAERADVAAGLSDDMLAAYDRLRARKVSPAVARFVGGACGGCHLTMPATEVDRIKKQPPEALVHCEQCGCLLVRGGGGA